MKLAEKKLFFKVTELSETFETFSRNIGDEIHKQTTAKKIDERTVMHLEILLWQVRTQLAMAQQLTMVAQHLGEIVAKSKTL